MNKIKGFVKKNYKIVIGFILGIIVCVGIGVSAVATKDIEYDNSTSGLTSTNLQGAIDELNIKAEKVYSKKNQNILFAYGYDSTLCPTGEESTCIETSCYTSNAENSCPVGTIIKYKVNDNEEKYFYVLHDDGNTITLQDRDDTGTSSIASSSAVSGASYGTYELTSYTGLNTIKDLTSEWTNVNSQKILINDYVANCLGDICTDEVITNARLINLDEAKSLGCTTSQSSCPVWMHHSSAYWLLDIAYLSFGGLGYIIYHDYIYSGSPSTFAYNYAIKAVIVINK